MREILVKLDQALNEVINKQNELNAQIGFYEAKKFSDAAVDEALTNRKADLDEREKSIAGRESKIKAYENLADLDKRLEQARDNFNNFKNRETNRLSEWEKKLKEEQGQIDLRKDKLAGEIKALNEEKETYKRKLEEEILAKVGFKRTEA